ncbi:nucleotide-diphosphate-sugar epimerase [Actinorhabdospora filicis]|uniref:Nucleotide-diphosphate-sugar epimerase n=1 Tax=Actinorhabdospora filicis TaxID=1785913 RepID=A0A9W6SJ74_9ACTN|nr:NAD(P)H-binding protein [Actinorhabdospora filicis]GLZ77253.1 nucleotide-diphosphate-sugar epimerase [Actinorhabdospora filicis]
MTILVTGATGNVGAQIVAQLAEAGHSVRALTRDASRASFPAGVEVAEGDLADPGTLTAALDGVTALHLIAIAGDNYQPLQTAPEILKLAAEQGATRVTVLCGPTSQDVEDAARASGIDTTALYPVEFMSNLKEYAEQVRETGTVTDGFGDSLSAIVHDADIAAVAVAALTTDGHAGKTYPITGPEVVTTRGKAAIIGEVLGREVPFVEVPEDEFRAGLIAQGWEEHAADWMVGVRRETPEIGRTVTDTVQQVTGRPARSMAQWVDENRALFG